MRVQCLPPEICVELGGGAAFGESFSAQVTYIKMVLVS